MGAGHRQPGRRGGYMLMESENYRYLGFEESRKVTYIRAAESVLQRGCSCITCEPVRKAELGPHQDFRMKENMNFKKVQVIFHVH